MIIEEINDEWIPLNKRDKLSIYLIFAIASVNLVPGLLFNIILTLLEPYVIKLDIQATVSTFILFGYSFTGFIVAPIIGVISDHLTFKYGRCRIFIIIGTILVAISLLHIMYCVELGELIDPKNPLKNAKIIFAISITISFISTNVIQSPAKVLCSDVTPQSQQDLMNNICQGMSGVSPLLSNLFGAFHIYKFSNLDQEKFLLITSLAIAIVAMLISVISANEEPLKIKKEKINPFKQIYKASKVMPRPFILSIPSYLLSNIASYQYQVTFSNFMGNEIFNGSNVNNADQKLIEKYQKGVSFSMMCNLMNNSVQLVYGFLNAKICQSIGMRWTMFIGNLSMGVGLLMFFFVSNKFAYFAFASLIGLGNVIYGGIPSIIVSIVVPPEELGNNLGILNCFCVIGQQLSNFGIGMALDNIIENSSRTKIGYSSIFAFLAAIASLPMTQPTLAERGMYGKITEEAVDRSFVISMIEACS